MGSALDSCSRESRGRTSFYYFVSSMEYCGCLTNALPLLTALREKARMPRSPERALLSGDEWPDAHGGDQPPKEDGFFHRRGREGRPFFYKFPIRTKNQQEGEVLSIHVFLLLDRS